MSINIPASITGGAQTGFTSPTYTTTVDVAPDVNGKQNAVTAIGGTQTGVRTHTPSDPFTITFVRPRVTRALPNANPVTGRYSNVPVNTYDWIFRKGVNYAANQAPLVAIHRSSTGIPAGADSYDSPNVRALASAIVGTLNGVSAGWGDTLVTGIM